MEIKKMSSFITLIDEITVSISVSCEHDLRIAGNKPHEQIK
jgi:hypothetical protein